MPFVGIMVSLLRIEMEYLSRESKAFFSILTV